MPQQKPDLEFAVETLGSGDSTMPDDRCNAYCANCDKGLLITGTGHHAKRLDPKMGGVYFCNEGCATKWDQAQSKTSSMSI